jgi:hypothetical protein
VQPAANASHETAEKVRAARYFKGFLCSRRTASSPARKRSPEDFAEQIEALLKRTFSTEK